MCVCVWVCACVCVCVRARVSVQRAEVHALWIASLRPHRSPNLINAMRYTGQCRTLPVMDSRLASHRLPNHRISVSVWFQVLIRFCKAVPEVPATAASDRRRDDLLRALRNLVAGLPEATPR